MHALEHELNYIVILMFWICFNFYYLYKHWLFM